jgi:hypothetical protein
MEPNTLLDALLDEAGMSHAGLAARINTTGQTRGTTLSYDHTAVARWIKGQRPRGHVPDLICDILAQRLQRPLTHDDIGMGKPGAAPAPTALAGFVERATALWRSDQQQRADVIAAPALVGTAAVMPVWEWENPPHDTDVSRLGAPRIGTGDVDMLRAARTRYENMYRASGGVATRGRIVGFLTGHTAPLLRGSYTDQVGRDLYRASGGLVAVAGICAYDSDAQGLAQRYFHHALRLAKASGDRAFGGYVIALLVNQAVYLKDYRQAVAFAEAGLRTAGGHISPGLSTDLNAMQAKAFARMGEIPAAHEAMARAEAPVAEALISLGDWSPARTFAEEAVRTQAHARGRVHRLATLTTVDLGRGEPERAAASALAALDLAAGMESQRLRDRFVALRGKLAGHGSTVARDAVEQIDASLSVPL